MVFISPSQRTGNHCILVSYLFVHCAHLCIIHRVGKLFQNVHSRISKSSQFYLSWLWISAEDCHLSPKSRYVLQAATLEIIIHLRNCSSIKKHLEIISDIIRQDLKIPAMIISTVDNQCFPFIFSKMLYPFK